RPPAHTPTLFSISEVRPQPLAGRATDDPRSLHAGDGSSADRGRSIRHRPGRDGPRLPRHARIAVCHALGRRGTRATSGRHDRGDEEPAPRPGNDLAVTFATRQTRTADAARMANALEPLLALQLAAGRRSH